MIAEYEIYTLSPSHNMNRDVIISYGSFAANGHMVEKQLHWRTKESSKPRKQ